MGLFKKPLPEYVAPLDAAKDRASLALDTFTFAAAELEAANSELNGVVETGRTIIASYEAEIAEAEALKARNDAVIAKLSDFVV
jgi:hypothetical protein